MGVYLIFQIFFFHQDQDQQSFPFCKNGAYDFSVPRWQTSRTWAWDSLPWMAHSAFCRTILEAIVCSMMFTETCQLREAHEVWACQPHHQTSPLVYISQSQPSSRLWTCSRTCCPSLFCDITRRPTVSHSWQSAILAKVAKRFCSKAQRSILNSHCQFTKKVLRWLNCLGIWDGLTAHLL